MKICYEENLVCNEKCSIVITLKYFNVEYIGVLYDDLSNTYFEHTDLVNLEKNVRKIKPQRKT